MRFFWTLLTSFCISNTAFAVEEWLIVSKNEILDRSGNISLEVIKPDSFNIWPRELQINLSQDKLDELVTLHLVNEKQGSSRQHYEGKAEKQFVGNVLVSLAKESSNRLMLVQNKPYDKLQTASTDVIDAEDNFSNEAKPAEGEFSKIIIPEPKEDRTITANEPLYFIVGSSNERDFDARFQLSFKYRPFDPEARVAKFIPYASNLYFAYTQTSIWDLGSESSPFKDTSYRPSIYYNWSESGKGYNPNSWKFGLEHESNGRDGDESRSLNIAFVQPIWNLEYSGGKTFTFMPRFYYYLEKSDNSDMHHYRGYVDWMARYGREDAAILTAMYRQGTDGYAQGQLDLSYPISDKIFGRTGTFLHLQLLGGYGETLIDYNKRSDTQLRIGISLAR
ncbi:MAG TPA: phospholipase A [Methylophilaceae bacterium]|nr:phospholipase A [Methylophilaceae bacterium]